MDVTSTLGQMLQVATQAGNKVVVRPEAAPQPDQGVAAPSAPKRVPILGTRTELDVDKPTGRFVGRLVNADTGAVVAQIPSEAILRLLEKTREMIRQILDKKA